MATQRESIFNGQTDPDNSGDVFPEKLKEVFDPSNLYDPYLWVFQDTGSVIVSLFGSFRVPEVYVGAPVIELIWSNTVTLGTLIMDFNYRAVGNDGAESFAITAHMESMQASSLASTTARLRQKIRFPLAGNFTPGDTVLFSLTRGNALDDVADRIYVFSGDFEYSDV